MEDSEFEHEEFFEDTNKNTITAEKLKNIHQYLRYDFRFQQ